jgi:hypothetical protein
MKCEQQTGNGKINMNRLTIVRKSHSVYFSFTSIGCPIIIYSYFDKDVEVSTLPYFAPLFFFQVCACVSSVLFLYCFIIPFPL